MPIAPPFLCQHCCFHPAGPSASHTGPALGTADGPHYTHPAGGAQHETRASLRTEASGAPTWTGTATSNPNLPASISPCPSILLGSLSPAVPGASSPTFLPQVALHAVPWAPGVPFPQLHRAFPGIAPAPDTSEEQWKRLCLAPTCSPLMAPLHFCLCDVQCLASLTHRLGLLGPSHQL